MKSKQPLLVIYLFLLVVVGKILGQARGLCPPLPTFPSWVEKWRSPLSLPAWFPLGSLWHSYHLPILPVYILWWPSSPRLNEPELPSHEVFSHSLFPQKRLSCATVGLVFVWDFFKFMRSFLDLIQSFLPHETGLLKFRDASNRWGLSGLSVGLYICSHFTQKLTQLRSWLFFSSFKGFLELLLRKIVILNNVMKQPCKLAVLAAVDESKITSVKLVTDLLLTSLGI